jgi:hypothetical protein
MQERWTQERWTREGREEARKEVASRIQEAQERFGVEQGGEKVLTITPEVLRFPFPSDEPEERS